MVSKIKLACVLIVSLNIAFLKGQDLKINLLLAEPPQPCFTFNDLWNLTIFHPIQSSQSSIYYWDFKVKLVITEESKGVILSATTPNFKIYYGSSVSINKFENAIIQPLKVDYSALSYSTIVTNGGQFPNGNYTLTYYLYNIDGNYQVLRETVVIPVASSCINPPLLLSVFDGDTIKSSNPLFSWTPPFPLTASDLVIYDITIAEIYPKQSSNAAIINNPAFYKEKNISNTFINYSIDTRNFKENTSYAWQVKAIVNKHFEYKSEIWTFFVPKTIKEENKPKKQKNAITATMNESSIIYQLENGLLSFVFEGLYEQNDSGLKYKLINDKQNEFKSNNELRKIISSKGKNQYELDFCNELRLEPGVYKLIIEDQKSNLYFINFNINNCN